MQSFTVIPAIDLRNGKCVRLRRGNPAEETVYSDDPVQMALAWEKDGAQYLHVVDLDGAFAGRPIHTELVIKIASALKIPVQVGGGLRTAAQIRHLIAHGVSRAIVGTVACQSENEIGDLIGEFKSKLAIGIDARKGLVQTRGWTVTTGLKAETLAERLDGIGAQTLIYTNTARDGMLAGPDCAGIFRFCRRLKCSVIASGGVATQTDISDLRKDAPANLAGVIVGKALYEGKISLKSVLA